MREVIKDILVENRRRNAAISEPFNPITGEGSVGERVMVTIPDYPTPTMWLPRSMLDVPLIAALLQAGSVAELLRTTLGAEGDADAMEQCLQQIVRIRCRYDFPFWAASFVYIKNKGGGEDVLFRLTRPQRRFVSVCEEARLVGKPIRIILLKARQWGGSTTSQLYMAWLQLVHEVGLNSLIIAHQGSGSDEINDMFTRMIHDYPLSLLHEIGETYADSEPKYTGVGHSGSIHAVPQRGCKIKIGTAERPDSCRGGDYNLVHLSEVGVWRATDGKRPEDIVRSACSGILYAPMTMIVYESTANGTGNFYHREYQAAKKGVSQFRPLFVSWFDIEQYSLPISDIETFAANLYAHRESEGVASDREESGRYLWWLWQQGATLEAINWYARERTKYNDHGAMAAEYPSDDIEAFVHSGRRVFDRYAVERLRPSCRPPKSIGEVYADGDEGRAALTNVRYREDAQGSLWVWQYPEVGGAKIAYRYLTVVDVGGRSAKADWSVICVIDRLLMADGDKPVVVAQWYGHCDIDILAWRAAQVAKYYDDALLVIESNTLETHDRERDVDGDQSHYILNQVKDVYDNLYARRQSEEEIREGRPRKYGFHTNVATKPMIISNLIKVVRDGLYTERDERVLNELMQYERKPNGAYGAIQGAHDDLLMTRAIGLHIGLNEMPLPVVQPRITSRDYIPTRAVSAATI